MLKKLPLLILIPVIAVLSVGCGGTRIYTRETVYRDREVPTVVYRDVPTVVQREVPAVVYRDVPVYTPPAPPASVQTTGYYDRWGNWHASGYYDAWGNWHPYPPPR